MDWGRTLGIGNNNICGGIDEIMTKTSLAITIGSQDILLFLFAKSRNEQINVSCIAQPLEQKSNKLSRNKNLINTYNMTQQPCFDSCVNDYVVVLVYYSTNVIITQESRIRKKRGRQNIPTTYAIPTSKA